jgi:ribosome-associated translation inhibitor RaiA
MQRFMVNLDRAIKDYVTSKFSTIDTHIDDRVDAKVEEALSGVDNKIETDVNNKVEEAMSGVDEQISEAVAGKADKPDLKNATLYSGNTTVTFTGLPTDGYRLVDVYTSKAGLNYSAIDDSTEGSLTLTYDVQSSDVQVYLRIEGIS